MTLAQWRRPEPRGVMRDAAEVRQSQAAAEKDHVTALSRLKHGFESRWSHHLPCVYADEYWAFANVQHESDQAHVTALIEEVTGPFGRVPRQSEAFYVFPSPEAPRKSAPNGNQMATI